MTDTVRFVVAKGKTTLDSWAVAVDDSVTALSELPTEPDVVFTLTETDGAALREGTYDLSVGFMRGTAKMAGDFGALLRVLPRLRALQVS